MQEVVQIVVQEAAEVAVLLDVEAAVQVVVLLVVLVAVAVLEIVKEAVAAVVVHVTADAILALVHAMVVLAALDAQAAVDAVIVAEEDVLVVLENVRVLVLYAEIVQTAALVVT